MKLFLSPNSAVISVSVVFVLYPVITQPYGVKKHTLKCDFIKNYFAVVMSNGDLLHS